jgi:hypothetical protein
MCQFRLLFDGELVDAALTLDVMLPRNSSNVSCLSKAVGPHGRCGESGFPVLVGFTDRGAARKDRRDGGGHLRRGQSDDGGWTAA